MGLTYGPLGTPLTELFPTAVRYTGRIRELQPGGHYRRVARALYRHLAGYSLRGGRGRLLPELGGSGDAAGAAGIGVELPPIELDSACLALWTAHNYDQRVRPRPRARVPT